MYLCSWHFPLHIKILLFNRIALILIEKPIQAFNMDGMKNNTGTIEHCAWLKIQMGKKKISIRFLATGLEKEKMILGLPWLKQYIPKIEWNTRTIDIDLIPVKTTFDRMLLRSIELARIEVITPQSRPTMKEIFEDRPFTSKRTSSRQWTHSAKPSYNRKRAQD